MNLRNLLWGVILLAASFNARSSSAEPAASGKELHQPQDPLPVQYWENPFQPTNAYGSYNTFFQIADGRLELWNNTIGDSPSDGIVRFMGTSPTEWSKPEVAIPHELITDVYDQEKNLSPKKRFTRPFLALHPKEGYFLVAHVCDGYPPRDGSVYPAWLTSRTGQAGDWKYHGRLRGEIEEFLPEKSARWADGGGLIVQPDLPGVVQDTQPMQNRFIFYSNQYPGVGCLALLYSADGVTWKFFRHEGKILNLLPRELHGKNMIFPRIVQVGKYGWFCWLSENWPPVAIWRLHSMDGLEWHLFGNRQPEMVVQPGQGTIKTFSGWYDSEKDILHGYLAVWEKMGEFTNYRLYHSTTAQFSESDE